MRPPRRPQPLKYKYADDSVCGQDKIHHWLGGYIGDDDAGGDDSCETTAGMYAYWKEKVCTDDSCTTTDEKVSRDATNQPPPCEARV